MQRSISLDVCDYKDTPLCNLYDSTNDMSGQATDVIVHTERNGFKEIRFNIPSVCADGEPNYRLDYLITDYKLRLYTNFNDPDKAEIDWFIISEPKVTHNYFSKNYEIRASHISNLLNTKNLSLEFSDEEGNNSGTIKQLASIILEGTGWHLGYVAHFYEEEKFVGQGVEKEKVRTFTASAKTGAFKMMSDLCDLFDAKPIYHGDGEYEDEEDGQTVTKRGRTVDILPLNPFSDKLEDGQIPKEVSEGIGVLELYYDKNVSSISRTANSENLVTVFSAYGSYGDENGAVSLRSCKHAEIIFGTLEAGTHCFEYGGVRYFFITDRQTTGLKWSRLDPMSRSYVFDGTNLFKVTTDIPDEYDEPITGETEYVKNQLSFIMDFSYYDKIGLLDDDMIRKIAQLQWDLPTQYEIADENSLALSTCLTELSNTASASNGFLMLDIESSGEYGSYLRLKLNKDIYPDGVIFRSDYDESRRNYFTWSTAKSIKTSGESIDGIGAVVYIVHQGNNTTWERAYVKCYGNETDNYYRDSLNNVYELHIEEYYDHKEWDSSDPDGTYFPTPGEENIIYIARDTKKMYVWRDNGYTEIWASGYNYGLNEFDHPDYITLWSTDDTWDRNSKVYMFASDAISGRFGVRELEVISNPDSIVEALKNGTTETHPILFLNNDEPTPDWHICESGYGWYYRSYDELLGNNKINKQDQYELVINVSEKDPDIPEITEYIDYYYLDANKDYIPGEYPGQRLGIHVRASTLSVGEHIVTLPIDGSFPNQAVYIQPDIAPSYVSSYIRRKNVLGDLYFCYGKAGEFGWSRVYISNDSNDPETISYIPGYTYYYSLKKMMAYKYENDNYVALKRTKEEDYVTAAFASVVEGCYKQEMLVKGASERYNYKDNLGTLKGNYAFKNEFDNYYLFSTGDRIVSNPNLVYYDNASRMVWLDEDEEHIVNSSEYSFRYLEFPKPNELLGISFAEENGVQVSSNITVHDKVEYEFNLPENAVVSCYNEYNTETGSFTYTPFTTPVHTTKVKIKCSTVPNENHYFRVKDYANTLFLKNVKYTILKCEGAGERFGMSYLMNKFIDLAHETYEVRVPALQSAQKAIDNRIKDLSEYLGDMYREGFWQETSYVEDDEDKLYYDALDNLKEISHPQYTYEVSFLDPYGSDDNLGAEIKTEYPDVDITYAAHLVDIDIDTNKWAYIDSIDKCYDQPWKTQLEINTQLSTIGQQSFTDVLGKIAEVASDVKAKQTIYDRAGSIGSSGQIAAEKLEGLIETNKIYLMGSTSNWYTDPKGNIVFESADGQSAMMLTGRGLMVSNQTDQYGDWLWRTAISGLGINADTISTGEFSASHITAGTITVDKLASNVGQELEIGSNKSLTLYATVDGSRPAGALTTQQPQEGDSWIQIAAKDGDDEAHIDIKSGGQVNLYGASSMNIGTSGALNLTGGTMNVTSEGKIDVSAGSINIASEGAITVNSSNLKIHKNNQDPSKYDVEIEGKITATSGEIAGYTIDSVSDGEDVIDFMYTGEINSIDASGNGVYIGTNGINIGNKLKYKISDPFAENGPSLHVEANSVLVGKEDGSYIKLEKDQWSMNAKGNITLTAGSTMNISSNGDLSITTNSISGTKGVIKLGNSSKPFTIGADEYKIHEGTSEEQTINRSFIYNGVREVEDISHNGVYIGTDGIVLGKGVFKVLPDGSLSAMRATIKGNVTAGSFNNGDSTFTVNEEGYVTATSGEIGGWTLSDTSLTGNKTGLAITAEEGDIAFWAGNEDSSLAVFKVAQDGSMSCSNATITGGSILLTDASNNTLFSVNQTDGAYIKGKLTATELYVGESTNLVDGNKLSFTSDNCTIASDLIDLRGKSITISQVSDWKDHAYEIKNGISITDTGVTITGKTLTLQSSSNISMTGGSISMYGASIGMTGGNIELISGTNKFKLEPTKFTLGGREFTDAKMFGRDDIIILRNGQSESSITPPTNRDWVLIKPYYNAEISFSYTGQYQFTQVPAAVAGTVVSEADQFGRGGTYYYSGSLKYYTSKGNSQRYFTLCLSNNTNFSPQVTIRTDHPDYDDGTYPVSFNRTASTINLCEAGQTIYFRVISNGASTLNGNTITIKCESDNTTSRVACNVFYYPKL